MEKTNTNRSYKTALSQFQNETGLDLEDIKRLPEKDLSKKIDKFIESLNIKDSSKLTRLSAIRSAIEQETDIQLTKSKIRKTLSKDKLRHSNKEEITTDELNKIIDYFFEKYKEEKRNKSSRLIPSLRNYILVKLLAFTGQRIGDILSLEVNEAKKETLFFKQDKTGAEVKTENPVLAEINLYIQLVSLSDNDYLFASGIKRDPISYTQILILIQKASLKVIGKEITPHSFRKYVVVKLREVGKADHEMKQVTGHSTSAMVDYYQGNKTSTIKNLSKLLTRKSNTKGKSVLAAKQRRR